MRLAEAYGVPAALLLSHSRVSRSAAVRPRRVLLMPGHTTAPAMAQGLYGMPPPPLSLEEAGCYDLSPTDSDCSSRSDLWDGTAGAAAPCRDTTDELAFAVSDKSPPCWLHMTRSRGPSLP
jgi:hypothetical protein